MIKRFNGSNPASFSLFSLFSNTKFTEKTVSFSGIQTQIVSIEGKHPDHMTTTTAWSNDSLVYMVSCNDDIPNKLHRECVATFHTCLTIGLINCSFPSSKELLGLNILLTDKIFFNCFQALSLKYRAFHLI